jgi:Na+-translocating ferredoxin:NAD+ oxidoreductase RnfD subunit
LSTRTLTLRGTSYPLILPSLRDPRLHVASVILTIHLMGQTVLDFRLSIPQILAAMLTCAVIEVTLTFRQSRSFVWPASAMLTGSGVALILRYVGTPPGDHWTTEGWWLFAIIAGLSLLSKYVIKYRGSHVFNPSNLGLVVAFVVLGSSVIEPLDFWWGPLDFWMAVAYGLIIIGGSLIDRRLHLLGLAISFWLSFAVLLGILAASGHCMVANWAFAPVCGADYWRVITFSPELMIFLLFMITDPKTAPGGQVGRVVFGMLVAAASVLLMAPQTNEFGAKVGLLAGLVVMCAVRPILDRVLPEPRSAADDVRAFTTRLATGGNTATGIVRVGSRVALAVVAVLVLGVGIVAAGSPARDQVLTNPETGLDRTRARIDPSTLPPITVGQDVADWDHELATQGMQDVVVTLAENLELEGQALLRRDPELLTKVDHGDRLAEMQARLQEAIDSGTTVVDHYQFDSMDVSLLVPFGMQTGLSLGFHAKGTVVHETYNADGQLQARSSEPFDNVFAVRRATGDRWLNVGVLPPSAGS